MPFMIHHILHSVDHKPHQPAELRRITSRGGSLVWLHGNKPYLRGADFLMRQANGEHPKQLNYSRALGGKDLKPFGLLAEPDVNHFQLEADDCLVLLGSDGLWDVLSPQEACELAWGTHKAGQSSAAALVEHAVRRMPAAGVRDNVTALALLLDPR
ncbi:protein serine/threonine phosphatase 2C family protein [archaeon]|nr:MAG: protein serine/threonine phosphatase 2C family protein [archaeon]